MNTVNNNGIEDYKLTTERILVVSTGLILYNRYFSNN